jgi:DNA-binding NarL/FixJ family response regulator
VRLVLSATEQRLLTNAARVLLSPLDTPVGPWRADVLQQLAPLLEAPMGGFILPAVDAPPYTLYNLPDDFAREYFENVAEAEQGRPLIQQLGGCVWNTRLLLRAAGLSSDAWFDSREYREFYSRYSIQDAVGFMVPAAEPTVQPTDRRTQRGGDAPAAPRMGAVVTVFHDVFGTPAFGERGLAKLRLLLPALEAGVAGRVRLAWMQTTLQEAFDVVHDGVAIHDADGRRLHANAALLRLLDTDPEHERIRAALEQACTGARQVLRGTAPAPAALQAVSIEIRTARARYRVRAQIAGGAPFGAAPVVIGCVSALTPPAPTAADLAARWSLSPQEARVALLLARGMSNAGIARDLALSPTTARHYTEAIFLKLQVHSRAEAARRLLVE